VHNEPKVILLNQWLHWFNFKKFIE